MYMKEKFGAWQIGEDPDSGRIEFKVFFPDRKHDEHQYQEQRKIGDRIVQDFGDPKIETIQVTGDFQEKIGQRNWDVATAPFMVKEPHAKGWVWKYGTAQKLPKGFYQYKYYVTFKSGNKRWVGDPCTRYGGSEYQNGGIVVGGSHSTVDPLQHERRSLRDLVLYELMIDDFTNEFRRARAPLDAVRDKVKYLYDLGISAILFLPWTSWPGQGFSWGYTPYQYFAVEYRYANAIDQPFEKLSWLKMLISECHKDDLHVIMDNVFNHVGDIDLNPNTNEAYGFPYLWLYENPEACPYVGEFGGTFSGLKDLDYHHGCTQELIRDVCFYWMDEFNIDGIRFDNTTNFLILNKEGSDWIIQEQRGLPQLLQDIQDHADSKGEKNFSLTLEHIDESAAQVTNKTAAISYWNNELYQRCFDYLWNRQIDYRIMGALNPNAGLQEGKIATIYIGNHDHSHVAWQAGARDNAGALQWYRTQPYLMALFTSPGVPMIQNGQEFAEDYWVMEDDKKTNRRVKPRALRWDFLSDEFGSKLKGHYQKLIKIRNEHSCLRSNNFYPDRWEPWQTLFNEYGYGVDVSKQLVIYHRWGTAEDGTLERFIITLNFSSQDQYVDIPFSVNGVWQDLLNQETFDVSSFWLRNQQITSNWGKIFFKKSRFLT
jgi:1,4-alpha-glucan branching enzyme